MKRILLLILCLSVFCANAQMIDFEDIGSLQQDGTNSGSNNSSSVDLTISSSNLNCSEQDSIPLRLLLILFKEKGSNLDFNQRGNNLYIGGGNIIGNCKKMLKFQMNTYAEDDNFYLKVGFDKNSCTNEKCTYEVTKKGTKESKEFTPNLQGFLDCLEYTEIFKKTPGGKYVKHENSKDNVTYSAVDEKIENVPNRTANLYFQSTGEFADYEPAYKKIDGVRENTCDYIEDVNKGGMKLYSSEDINYNEDYLKFQQVCKETDYKKIIANLDDLSQFERQLLEIAGEQIESELKKVVGEIKTVENKDEISKLNLDVLEDFQKYVIYPLEKKIEKKFDEWYKETDATKKKKLAEELETLKKQLEVYGSSPYLDDKVFKKLLTNGHFPAAKTVYLSLKSISEFKKVGKTDNKIFKPEKAWDNIREGREAYDKKETSYIESYERKNCIRTGEASSYISAIKAVNLKLQILAKNYKKKFEEIDEQRNKTCNKQWVDRNSCLRNFHECEVKLKEEYYKKRSELNERLKEYNDKGKVAFDDEKECKSKDDDTDSDSDDDDIDLKPSNIDFSWSNIGTNSNNNNNWAYNLNQNNGFNWNNNQNFSQNYSWLNNQDNNGFNMATGLNFNLGTNFSFLGGLGGGNNYFGYNNFNNPWGNNNFSTWGSTPNYYQQSPWGQTSGINPMMFQVGPQRGPSNGLFNF